MRRVGNYSGLAWKVEFFDEQISPGDEPVCASPERYDNPQTRLGAAARLMRRYWHPQYGVGGVGNYSALYSICLKQLAT